MKRRIKIILIIMLAITITTSMTYSLYTSGGDINVESSLASFVLNVEKTESIDIPLQDLKPGDELVYDFSILNNSDDKTSDVSIVYNITIMTLHFIPLDINLYDSNDNLVLTCDEGYSRNLRNELECKSNDIDMSYLKGIKDDYKLKIKFDEKYSESEYSSLVDYINLKIDSYQKVE